MRTQLLLCPFCYGDEENGHRARTSGHLTTANQSKIRKVYLVSVNKESVAKTMDAKCRWAFDEHRDNSATLLLDLCDDTDMREWVLL